MRYDKHLSAKKPVADALFSNIKKLANMHYNINDFTYICLTFY